MSYHAPHPDPHVLSVKTDTQLSRPQGYKTFPYSNQLSTKFILLINVKMPTVVGILTFISMINTSYERLKARNFFICIYILSYDYRIVIAFYSVEYIMSSWNFVLSWVEHGFFITSGPCEQELQCFLKVKDDLSTCIHISTCYIKCLINS